MKTTAYVLLIGSVTCLLTGLAAQGWPWWSLPALIGTAATIAVVEWHTRAGAR